MAEQRPAVSGLRESLTVGERTFTLPYSAVIRALTDAEYGALRADIAQRGAVVVPVITDEHGAVIDGHHRLRVAQELGLRDVPVEVRAGLSDDEKEALAHDLNDHRRQLSVDEQRQRAAQRRERVARRREDGQSLRSIAEVEGVSYQQVARDVDDDVTPVTSSSPGVVTARNGQVRRTPRDGVGAQVLGLLEQHPDWAKERVAREAAVAPSYVSAVIRRQVAPQDADQSARTRRAPGRTNTKDDQTVRRATVAHLLDALRWEPLEALLAFAMEEQLSAKAVLRLCREIRRDAQSKDKEGRGSDATRP